MISVPTQEQHLDVSLWSRNTTTLSPPPVLVDVRYLRDEEAAADVHLVAALAQLAEVGISIE